jgi:hypothetical protein
MSSPVSAAFFLRSDVEAILSKANWSQADVRVSQEIGHNACLWELTKNGTTEVPHAGGKWLEAGDRVTFDGWASGKGGKRIGFGEVTTKLLAADKI